MAIIYLYVKTHNKTGLKYLGKTSSKNPGAYKGSGKYWSLHIKKHGYDVTTEIIKECYSNKEVAELGEHYSKLWNIVESTEWANLKPESGDGGDTSMTENFQKSLPQLSIQRKTRKWWTNGIEEKHCKESPANWVEGRIPRENLHNCGKKYWNNGIKSVMSIASPGSDWAQGMLTTDGAKLWTDGATNKRATVSPGPGWILGHTKKPGVRWTNGKDIIVSLTCPGPGWKQGSIATVKGRKWWTNGIEVKYEINCPGLGWIKGRKLKC